MTDEVIPGISRFNAASRSPAKAESHFHFRSSIVAGDPAGFAERDDVGDVFGAGPAAAFLAGAEEKRRQS